MFPESATALSLTHVPLQAGTVRRFLEKHEDKITAVVFCISSATDTDIYKRSGHSSIFLEGVAAKLIVVLKLWKGFDILEVFDQYFAVLDMLFRFYYLCCNFLEWRIMELPFYVRIFL